MNSEIIDAQGQNLGPMPIPSANQVAALDDEPGREIKAGLIIALVFFLGFLGWAHFARLDSAAYAIGKVTVSGQRQTVQHRDGGVVGEIFVKDGQRVRQGQVLLRLAAAEVQAQERALSSQMIGLLAQRARLRAEQLGVRQIPVPAEFAALEGRDRAEAQQAMRMQTLQLRARSSLLSTQQGVLGQQRAQVGEQSQGFQSQLQAIREQERLLNDELKGLRTVAEQGFVSMNRIRALERALADLAGQRGRLQASISESTESVGENRLRIVETERSLQDRVATELREVEFSLSEILPKLRAAKDQLARTEVRAPASGSIVGLSVFTEGGVIAPGQKLMDIVPERSALLVEARVAPNDVDDLVIGQEATVRFSGLQDRDLPTLYGNVRRISADSFADEKTGEAFFTADIVVPPDQIEKIQDRRGAEFTLKPGMPVQVLVPLRKRTALEYLFQPLTETLWRSFREG